MHFWDQHKTITRYYEILMSSVCEKYQLKHLEYDILMFLHNNPQYRTAADIVRVRKSTKSHVSTSLKTLEDRGFIAKKTDPVNKKHIELDLLEPANELVRDGLLAQRQFTEQMLRGLTPGGHRRLQARIPTGMQQCRSMHQTERIKTWITKPISPKCPILWRPYLIRYICCSTS